MEPLPAAKKEPLAQSWGSLRGRFLYDGEPPTPEKFDVSKEPALKNVEVMDESLVVAKDRSLANVVIWVRTTDVAIHPSYEPKRKEEVVIRTRGGRIEPHIATYWTGQPWRIKNEDPFASNLNLSALENDHFGAIVPTGDDARPPYTKPEACPVSITCNIHPWMRGYLVIRPNPYVAVSGKDGRFEIKNLPAGVPLELQVWHERGGRSMKGTIDGKETNWDKGRFTMTLKNGENNLGEVKFALEQFQRDEAGQQARPAADMQGQQLPNAAADEPSKQTWGDLKVRFLYDGEPPEPVKLKINRDVEAFGGLNLVDESLVVAKDGSLANVVVWLRTPNMPIHPSYDALKEVEATIQSAGGQFTPRIVSCRTGQPLELRNLDAVPRNVQAHFAANDPFNLILRANSLVSVPPPSREEPVPVSVDCNIHAWMQSWLVVQPHPYVGVSDREGKLEIKNLPTGVPMEFQLWHERVGYVTKVNIDGKETDWPKGRFIKVFKSGENDMAEIKIALRPTRVDVPPAGGAWGGRALAPPAKVPLPARQPDASRP